MENTLMVISVFRRNYFAYIMKRGNKGNKKHEKKKIYTRNQPEG